MQLYTPIELKQFQQDLPYLIEISEWVQSFLAQPHPDLGRPGSVCPFVPHALKSNSIRVAAIRAKNLQPQQVEEIVLGYRDIFLEIEPQATEAALYKAILLVFTDIQIEDTNKLIDGVQQKLKPLFVESGLMLGEFHNLTESPGLHNPNFRPLRSPIPILAIRFMVESDLPFLQSTDDLGLRIRYLEAYLQRFEQGGKEHINYRNARQILALALTQLEQQTLLPSSCEIFHKSIESLAGMGAKIPGQKYIGIDGKFFLTLGDLRKVDICKKTMLEGIVANSTESVGQPLVRPFDDTQVEYPQDACIHSLFEAQVERSPDAVAVVFSEEHLTYRELNSRANQLAHHLQALGVKAETLVGLCVERSIEMVVSMLGILKAGGAYVPLDPGYPEERLKFMLSDSQASVLVTQKLLALLPAGEALLVCLDTDSPVISQQSQENAVSDVTADNLIYVIYTSGSTGQPKGVMIPHRGICNQLYWRQTTFGLSPIDKVLQTISLSFDPSVWQIFWPLLFGAQLILARPGGHQDTAYLVQTIAQQHISVIALVPSILRVLLQEQGLENCQCLKHVTIGGEAIPVELIERFFERLPLENVLYNCYGPTEAAIDATFWRCQSKTTHTIAPIGRPIANTQIYILDEDLQPVSAGETGEVYIGGTLLARGYLNCPELTAQKFICNPFVRSEELGVRTRPTGGAPPATNETNTPIPPLPPFPPLPTPYSPLPVFLRLYKTGDLGRYLPDGNIQFLGRIDQLVKIRGFRIELGEIEAMLGQHPAVQETVVIVREDVPGDKQLVAYVVPRLAQVTSTDELRSFLNQKLPNYMIPSSFIMLEALPLTPNGKVDRLALSVLDWRQFKLKKEIVAPRTLTEEMLARIWAEVLRIESFNRERTNINIYDNFFDLGGHSLAVPLLVTRIQQVFHIELPLWRLFEAPTIAGLAENIESERQAKMLRDQTKSQPWSCVVPIQLGGSKRPFFLIPGGIIGGEPEFMTYAKLVYFLGQEQPVYGLKARDWEGNLKPHTRVEAMASDYIKEISMIQPSGPYLLGGECMGGVVAFEMARQLVAVGQKVDLLVLIDTKIPTKLQKLGHLLETVSLKAQKLRKIPYYLNKLLQRDSKESEPYTFNKAAKALTKLAGPTYGTVLMRYKLRTYTGRITLLVNEDYFQENPSMGWHDLAIGGLEIHKIPGNHESYLGEHVKTTAEKLKACLDAALMSNDVQA